MKFLLLLLPLIAVSLNADFTKYFMICKRSDPDLNECLKSAVQYSMKFLQNDILELGIPTIQSLEIPEWSIPSSAIVPFVQNYKNLQINNHKSIVINELQAVITDSQLFIIFSGFIPTLNIAGFYHFENALLDGINMTGNGTLTTTLNNNKFDMKINASAISDGSQTKFSEATIDFRLCPERMVFAIGRQHLELNNGLKQFSNNYSFLLFQEFRSEYSRIFAEIYEKYIKLVFSKLGFDEIFPR